MNQLLPALIAVALTGVLRMGYAASPDDPSAPQRLRAPAPDLGSAASTAYTLTLDQAMVRMLDKHPDLKLLDFTVKTLQADRDTVSQGPSVVAGLRMPNAHRTQETTSFKNAEITLTSASCLSAPVNAGRAGP
jgi:hypothetical protein